VLTAPFRALGRLLHRLGRLVTGSGGSARGGSRWPAWVPAGWPDGPCYALRTIGG